jgi:hypothetical protein
MRLGTHSPTRSLIRSRHGAWRDSRTSRATQCGVTPFATSHATFSNATVDISRATRFDATKRATSWNFSWGEVSFKILD